MIRRVIKPMKRVEAELDPNGRRIRLYFEYNRELVNLARTLPGATFKNTDKTWSINADIESARLLREVFKDDLVLGPNLKQWGHAQVEAETKLKKLATATTAELDVLPTANPELYEAIYCGPQGKKWSRKERQRWMAENQPSFQAADVKFMAVHPGGCANFNQPGTGKTLELMATAAEAQMTGPKLVVAPLTSLDSVWQPHLEFWQKEPVIVPMGDKYDKALELSRMELYLDRGDPFWVVVNPAMLTLRRNRSVSETDDNAFWMPFPELYEVNWDMVVVDEFHLMGLGNTQSNTFKGLTQLKANKRIPTSGTPFGGKPEKLFGILHFASPKDFTSKWRFFAQWFEIFDNEFTGYKQVGKMRAEREEEFKNMLTRYAVRREKSEVLPWLPPKLYADTIWADMGEVPTQAKQYKQFALETEIKIDDMNLTATSVLAEYTRLKQFADSRQKILGYDANGTAKLQPMIEFSCKLPHLMEILAERGIVPAKDLDKEDVATNGDREQVLVFSQFTTIVNAVADHLESQGIKTARIHGGVNKKGQRKDIVNRFQAGEYQVIVMNTTAGGVSITLDNANTVVFLDETWNPDDQEQAEDRCHRGDKTQRVTVYYIKSRKTIEEVIEMRVDDKSEINRNILAFRKAGKVTSVVEE